MSSAPAAASTRRPDGRRAWHGVIYVGLTAAALFFPMTRQWPWVWVVPLAVYAALVAMMRPLRESYRPLRLGRITGRLVAATALVAIGSSAALLIFDSIVRPDVGSLRAYLRTTTLADLVITWILFSIVNAILEELAFRGVLFDAMESRWGNWGALVGTSILFGLGHMQGYPPGPIGAVMAGVYALCLGGLRIGTGGLALPILAHIVADATIFAIVARSRLPQ